MPQWWEFSSHYNRHIPSNVSSAEQGILMKLRPLSSIVVSVVRSAADDDCLASTLPPTADRRLRWVYNRKDAGMLIVRLHLTLTPTSLNLYTARQGYNHRRSISRVCMMYNLYISKVSYSICYFIYTIRLSLLTLLVHQYLIRMHIGHEIIAPVSLPLVLPTATNG